MVKNYIFRSTCYDRELFRRLAIALKENSVDFKVITKSKDVQSRAPLSQYFEVEIHINEPDYEKGDRIMRELED